MAEVALGTDGLPLVVGSSNDPTAVTAATLTSLGKVNDKTFWDYFDINNALNSVLNFSLGMWGKNPSAQSVYASSTGGTSGVTYTVNPDGTVTATGTSGIPWSTLLAVGGVCIGVIVLFNLISKK